MSPENNPPAGRNNWPKDWFGCCETLQSLRGVVGPLLIAVALLCLSSILSCNRKQGKTVVAYISQDQVYAEPFLNEFKRETGIRVRPIFDSEAVKTVAIANRLLAERARPQCDLYWGNEELRTRQLAAQDLFRKTNAWTTIGYRSRRLVINTNKLTLAGAPRSLLELTNPIWRGQVALAYPLFGTTSTHFLALRQQWGDDAWQNWCRALQANRPFLVDGNSVVVQFVSRGQARIGLTDSDDIAAAQREGAPVAALPLTAESLLIPNTIAVVRAAPHPAAAEQLYEFLQRHAIVDQLIAVHALEGAAQSEVTVPTLRPDWPRLLQDLAPASESLKRIFLR